MTWRRVALYWAGFVMLVLYYVAVERRPVGPEAARLTHAPFINLVADQVVSLELRRATAMIRCQRVAGRWQVTAPPGSTAPPDLVDALVANLVQLTDVELVTESASDLAQFGLDPPACEMILTTTTGQNLGVRLGARNPAGTAVYAQRTDSRRVVLIGLNVRYYEDLLFESLRTSPPPA